ncbi:MAG: hypothetical protein JW837_19355 [Sedimentisphaerales bacterium]|nr:hypothetical protein [Sedimentisphaerales bacterium]
MLNGLWTIEFMSIANLYGTGVLVLNNGRLLGGDAGYYYSGEYKERGDKIDGIATITRFEPNSISVFGNYGQLTLCFSGKVEDNYFLGEAWLRDDADRSKNVQIKCTKKEDIERE